MQSGTELEMKIAWVLALVQCMPSFLDLTPRAVSSLALTLLTHSWVVWNNRWLPSNQMPHHQRLSLGRNGLLAANRSASIGGKRLDHWAPACDSSADSDWLWARDLAFVGVSVHDWPVCVVVCWASLQTLHKPRSEGGCCENWNGWFPPQHVSFHIRCDLVFHSSQGSGEVKEKVREKSLCAKGPVLFGV